MKTRERFQAVMGFKPFDRLPLLEWADWWDKTLQVWRGQGLPNGVTDRYQICDHFGLDLYKQDWIPALGPGCPSPPAAGLGIVESDSDYDNLKRYLYPSDAVNSDRWQSLGGEQGRNEVVLWFTVTGFFWFPRQLMGIERHMYAFYDQPGLIHRINSDLADWMVRVIDEVCSICRPDFMTFAEDMSYNHGAMISEQVFDEFIRPYYDRVVPVLRENGVLPIVDSDGDVGEAICWFEDAGIAGILPLERQAGSDISRLRSDHPSMSFIGHFDKLEMNKGEEAIRREFERLLPTAARGGFLISCDHQTPPEVSYDDYLLYLSLFREYAERAGEMSREIAEADDRQR